MDQSLRLCRQNFLLLYNCLFFFISFFFIFPTICVLRFIGYSKSDQSHIWLVDTSYLVILNSCKYFGCKSQGPKVILDENAHRSFSNLAGRLSLSRERPNMKEYATIDTIMAYLTTSPFRIKADRIFKSSNFTLSTQHTSVLPCLIYCMGLPIK